MKLLVINVEGKVSLILEIFKLVIVFRNSILLFILFMY